MNKNSKSINIILVIGIVFMIVGYYFALAFLWNEMQYFIHGSNLDTGLGVAFGLILLWLPAVVISIISFILNLIAYKKTIKPRGFIRITIFVLSIVLPVICLGEFIATRFI